MRTPRHETTNALSRAIVLVARNKLGTFEKPGTVSELARRSGVNRSALQWVLSGGRAVSLGALQRVAAGAGMTASALLAEAEAILAREQQP